MNFEGVNMSQDRVRCHNKHEAHYRVHVQVLFDTFITQLIYLYLECQGLN